jgi:hypothetical protein
MSTSLDQPCGFEVLQISGDCAGFSMERVCQLLDLREGTAFFEEIQKACPFSAQDPGDRVAPDGHEAFGEFGRVLDDFPDKIRRGFHRIRHGFSSTSLRYVFQFRSKSFMASSKAEV